MEKLNGCTSLFVISRLVAEYPCLVPLDPDPGHSVHHQYTHAALHLLHQEQPDQIKSNQIKSNQIKSNQIKSEFQGY